MKLRTHYSIFFLALFFTTQAFAWGDAGHQAVAIIAEQNLKPEVNAKITKLLDLNEDLAAAALWPDNVKVEDQWLHTRPYHYVTIPNQTTYYQALQALSSREQKIGDVVRALVKAEDILRDSQASADSKTYALRFMVHFVGDLHQPLHVGLADDRGGNFTTMTWNNVLTNLHAVWDIHLINSFIGRFNREPQDGSIYAKSLRQPSAAEITKWQNSYILSWIDESQGLRASTYKGYKGANATYLKNNINQLNDRVLQGGYRLAALLNAIFTNSPFIENEALKLRTNLNSILGPKAAADIVLEPQAK